MDFKSLLSQLDQLNEAKEKTKTGLKHTAEPGGYGRKDDEDDEGNKVKSTAAKKGKGRPKKDADDSGETKKYDFSAFGVKSGKDVKLPKHDKKKTTVVKGKSQSHADNKKDDGTGDEEPKTKAKKKSLKEYFDALDQAMLAENEMSPDAIAKMNPQHKEYFGKNPHFTRGAEIKSVGKTINAKGNPISALATKVTPKFNKPNPVQRLARGSFNSPVEEAEQIQIKPASQMPKQPGQTSMQKPAVPGQPQQVAGQPAQNTQVIAQGNKTLGTVNNPQLAQQIKQSIGKGEMTLMPDQMHEEDIGKHNNATTGFDALVRKLTPKYGVEAAKRIAGAQMKKIKEADQPPNDSLMSPISEARAKADDKAEKAGKKVTKDLEYDMKHKGKDDNKAEKAGKKVTKDIEYDEKKKKTVKEAAKPDFPDIDNDGNKKETIAKAAQDAKKDKKKVKEGMEHKLKAARHTGKAHALSKQGYNCGYDDMEESRHYHEGYKEGLDECYGQMPIQGYVGETSNEVADMASYGAHTPQIADEGNAFTDKLRKTPDGGTFRMGRNTYTDRSSIEESPFAFEAWDKELNAILEGKEVTEGVTISSSTGQQGSPNSVSINATDADADSVLNMIKQLGLGGLGGQEQAAPASQAMSLAPADDGEMPAEIEVVDDHDDMLSLMRKMSGQGPAVSSSDYEDEGGEPAHSHEEGSEDGAEDDVKEETCESCGSAMQEGHSCGEAVEENETIPQEDEEVAEDAAQNDGQAETTADENAEAEEDQALATVDAAQNESDEELEESLANGDDDTFESDINFMTKVISGGLNGQKRTQSVGGPMTIASTPMRESTDLLHDWKKLSGIK